MLLFSHNAVTVVKVVKVMSIEIPFQYNLLWVMAKEVTVVIEVSIVTESQSSIL